MEEGDRIEVVSALIRHPLVYVDIRVAKALPRETLEDILRRAVEGLYSLDETNTSVVSTSSIKELDGGDKIGDVAEVMPFPVMKEGPLH